MSKRFQVMFLFVSWTDISLGVNLDVKAPRIEIHLPFGFISIGWEKVTPRPLNWRQLTSFHYLVGNPNWKEDEL